VLKRNTLEKPYCRQYHAAPLAGMRLGKSHKTMIGPGARLGRYEIRSKIGQGGMGEVYLAEDTKLDRKVALKILPAEVAADRERIARFVKEAKAASALNHPNIMGMTAL